MDPGEQTTGTRDEHYNLISVLYHALHGAENCNTYALDAEAAGEAELADFFREAGVRQAQLAERAKDMLGIGGTGLRTGGALAGTGPPETEIPPEDTGPVDVRGRAAPEVGFAPEGEAFPGTEPLEGISPRSADVQREPNIPADEAGITAEEVPPSTEVPSTPPGEEPPEIPGGVPPERPTGEAAPEEAPPTTGGVEREVPPPGEERPERRGEAPSTPPSSREEPPPGEERPERRAP
jgi:hypothetical protein